MKVIKSKSKRERDILTAMIVDNFVLGRMESKYQSGMFRSRWSNEVAKWCVRYYRKYNKAPKTNIEKLYENWSAKTRDKSIVEIVGKFLRGLSDEYEGLSKECNSDYIIDIAGEYFNEVQMERLLDNTSTELENNEVQKAHQQLLEYNKIDLGIGEGINVLHDKDAVKEAFKEKKKTIVEYPGTLGKFFKNAFHRDAFVSFMGREGIGKSFWLLDLAYRAVLQRRKVAFFEAGDNSKKQVMMRIISRICRQPFYVDEIEYPTSIEKIRKRKKVKVLVSTETKTFPKKLSWQRAMKKCQQVMERKVKSKSSYFKLSCHPNDTLTIGGIESILQDWERAEEWSPDVIVIDYADILDMSWRGLEGRDLINKTWKQLRRISQKRHCLVVTATQADAKSYEKGLLTMSNFSDDKRKFAHVTGMIGINQSPNEKKKTIMRLNWLKLRDEYFYPTKCVYVANCLGVANPAVKSCF